MNPRERLFKALRQEPVDRPPAAVPTQPAIADVMEASGYAWPKAQREGKAMAGLAWACHEIGGIESVRVPFDINVEAEAMGCETRFGDDATTPPMSKVKDGRMPAVLEASQRLRTKTEGRIPLIAAFGTPFELLATTLDFEDLTMALLEDNAFLEEQLEKMTQIAIRYGSEIEKAGPDVLMLVDGTSQTIGPDHFDRFSFPYTCRLVDVLSKPAILHICGNPSKLLPKMAETGVMALSIDAPVDIDHARKVTAGKVALVGQISPQTLATGDVPKIIKETEASLRRGVNVIAPGCGILPQTPLAHLKAYLDTVACWKQDQSMF
jgi:[methyl-Co(III) methanol-specific corrinoid protein]:coenzyme M methyltransferase